MYQIGEATAGRSAPQQLAAVTRTRGALHVGKRLGVVVHFFALVSFQRIQKCTAVPMTGPCMVTSHSKLLWW